jgi:hypothetical protein
MSSYYEIFRPAGASMLMRPGIARYQAGVISNLESWDAWLPMPQPLFGPVKPMLLTLKKYPKTVNAYYPTHIPKMSKSPPEKIVLIL